MKYGDDKNIEDVEIGDEVLSYNVHTNEFEPKLVTKLYNQTHNLKDGDITVKIKFSNGIVTHNTIANPFWSKDKGFVAADADRCKFPPIFISPEAVMLFEVNKPPPTICKLSPVTW